MTVGMLSARRATALQAASFTYSEVGATGNGRPEGYDWLERSALLVRRDFEAAAQDLLAWRLHEWAGLRVQASESPLRAGTVVLMRLGLGAASIRIPCRVVYVMDEPTRCGFSYGTLPGHPESGEEKFILERRSDGTLVITITAFSRPDSRLAILGGPVTRRVQHLMTSRYLRALDHSR